MKESFTVMRPIKQRSKSALTKNMFSISDKVEEDSLKFREKVEQYDFVGPTEFRKKLITNKTIEPIMSAKDKLNDEFPPFNQTITSKNPMNTTINRNTMLQSLHKDQLTELTKHSNNLRRFKGYQDVWDKTKLAIKKQTDKKSPILMDNNIKSLYVHPNQDKTDIINNYIVHYWEMSLRNHNPILERHIKGNRFQKLEKEKLLQLIDGTKKVENSIPSLPVEKLTNLKKRQISLNGRNKIKMQLEKEYQTEKTQTRFSLSNTIRLNQQQVFKINYQGPKRWMGTQNL